MCLATVYKESDDSVIFKNVARIDVDGNKLVLRDIMGDERVVEGRILMVDLANSIVKLKGDNENPLDKKHICGGMYYGNSKINRTDERKTAPLLRTLPAEDRQGNGKPSGYNRTSL